VGNPKSYFTAYQWKWILDESPVKIMEKSRRIGMTYAQAFEDVRDCVRKKVPAVFFSSADDSAAKEYIIYCSQWAKLYHNAAKAGWGEEVADERSGHKAYSIDFKNGTRIIALSSNPKNFRSKGGKVVLDEFAFHENAEALWKAANASGGFWEYPIRILSTHNGKNCLYYQFLERAGKGELDWSHHKVDIYDAVDQGVYDRIKNRPTTQEEREAFISKLRRDSFSEDIFLEEFCCQAVDSATAFLTYDVIRSCEETAFLMDEEEGAYKGKKYKITTLSHPTKRAETIEHGLYIGVDVARKKDLTVIWIAAKNGKRLETIQVIVLEKAPFWLQEKVLFPLIAHPRVVRCCIDSTGLGSQIAERAQDAFGIYKVEAVLFTSASKPALMFGLLEAFEDDLITIPNDKAFREDFHALKKVTSSSGAVRFDSDSKETDAHSDRAIACALCIEAAKGDSGEVWALSKSPRSGYALSGY
jgi:phage FluMu gp28-like protein